MNDDYSLTSDSNIIPAQYSENIKFHFEVLPIYKDSLIVPGYLHYDGCTKVESAVDNYNNGEFTIPANAFSNEGVLAIAFAITTGEETVTTTPVEFEVRGSVNTSFSLPSTEIWQSMLQSFMDQYMDKVYSDEIRILIDKCKELQANGEILQELINLAINSCGQYKFENGFLFFKQADGTWGEGINLNVSVEEFENVVRRVTNLETNGVSIGDPIPIGTIVYVEGDEKDLRTGYEKIDVFPPKQLLINNDFQVWQRGESFDYSNSQISKNTYLPDMWAMGNGSKNFIISKDDNGCHLELKVANSYLDLRQCVFGLKAGDTVTMSMKITNSGESFTMLQRIGNDGTTNKNINVLKGEHIYNLTYTLKDTDIRSDGGFVIYPLLGYANKTFDIIINYVDLFEGDIVYPHIKEDYAIALMRCQSKLVVYRNAQVGNGNVYNNIGYIGVPLPVPMQNTPTIKVEGYRIVTDGLFESAISYINVLSLSNNMLSLQVRTLGEINSSVNGYGTRLIPSSGTTNSCIEISCEPI